MATPDDVEQSLRTLAKMLEDASPDPSGIPDRTILCICPDLKMAFKAEMKQARLTGLVQVETTEKADVRITARSDDLIALIGGRLAVGFAFLTGKVRIDASPRDLMLLRQLF